MIAPQPRVSFNAAAHPPRSGIRTPTLTVVPLDPENPRRQDDVWVRTIACVAQQDRAAFARLFDHFAPRVKRYLMLAGSSESQAEDLTQETLAMVWRKADLFDASKAGVTTWVFTIARHLRVDFHRKRSNLEASDDGIDFDLMEADQPAVDEVVDAARLELRLRAALSQLTPEQWQVVRLAYGDDESHSRIAASLGIPLGTVKSRVRAALTLLRRLMET